jgi:DNA-binding MarR family transcriptional regulator
MKERITPAQVNAWRLFITAHATLIEQIDRELSAAGCVPLQWYDILVELYEAPDHRLRMAELARRAILSRSSLTHLADRLEHEGLLTRARVDTDRRGAYAVLTEQGDQAFRRAWPIYARGIAQHFIRHLTDEEIQTLTDVFQRLLLPTTPAEG